MPALDGPPLPGCRRYAAAMPLPRPQPGRPRSSHPDPGDLTATAPRADAQASGLSSHRSGEARATPSSQGVTLYVHHRGLSQSSCIPTKSSTSHLSTAMALQLLPTSTHLPTFSGLKAASSVRQVNKLSGLGCVKRTSASQSIKAVMNPMDDPILKEAMKEPIAFLGGVFAGLLRLDLNEEPLKDWVAKTAEAAGIDMDDSQAADIDDSVPEDIRID